MEIEPTLNLARFRTTPDTKAAFNGPSLISMTGPDGRQAYPPPRLSQIVQGRG